MFSEIILSGVTMVSPQSNNISKEISSGALHLVGFKELIMQFMSSLKIYMLCNLAVVR